MYRSYVQGSCGKTRYQRAVEAEIIDNRNSEPEELTIGISELDDIENKIDLEVISKEINRRDSKVGRIFELLTFHGYKLEDIARSEKLNTKLSFMSAVQK